MLVKFRTSERYPELRIGKYAKRVFWDNLWTDELEHYRGIVLDEQDNIVSYPFTKIYNYGIEARAPSFADDEYVYVHRKVNGFMAAVTWYKDDILVSTTGSLDSLYVQYIYDLLDVEKARKVCSSYPDYTFMFECVHPSDPHIIPEVTGLYYLGCRKKELGSPIEFFDVDFGCFYPDYLVTDMADVKELVKTCKHEGFVIYHPDGRATKIKSPYYLMKKFLARSSTKRLLEGKHRIAEEYYPIYDKVQENLEYFTSLSEQERLEWIRNAIYS